MNTKQTYHDPGSTITFSRDWVGAIECADRIMEIHGIAVYVLPSLHDDGYQIVSEDNIDRSEARRILYIVDGNDGVNAQTAFQCPDTGWPILATFHHSTRRLACEPIEQGEPPRIPTADEDGRNYTLEWCRAASGPADNRFQARKRLVDHGVPPDDAYM